MYKFTSGLLLENNSWHKVYSASSSDFPRLFFSSTKIDFKAGCFFGIVAFEELALKTLVLEQLAFTREELFSARHFLETAVVVKQLAFTREELLSVRHFFETKVVVEQLAFTQGEFFSARRLFGTAVVEKLDFGVTESLSPTGADCKSEARVTVKFAASKSSSEFAASKSPSMSSNSLAAERKFHFRERLFFLG